MRSDQKQSNELKPPFPSGIHEDFYFENGLMVFTEHYHLKRGKCCGNQCRHCPYDWINVTTKKKA